MNTRDTVARILLLPFALIFGLLVGIKELFYRTGVLRGVAFGVPVISVGNLSAGGTGKTPHVEYLIRMLRPYLRVGALSRGYLRETSGFLLVHRGHGSRDAGDEPVMFARKHPDVVVAVAESRQDGILMMLRKHPGLQVILLDDAYQHRSVIPFVNILLTAYDNPFYSDWPMPAGTLREWRPAYQRADIIIVTKCPEDLTTEARDAIVQKVRPLDGQAVFFSHYRYHRPYAMYASSQRITLDPSLSVVLLCGIARVEYLLEYVERLAGDVNLLQYADHHAYTRQDVELLHRYYENLPGTQKIILTTEKDAVRLEPHGALLQEYGLPVFCLPVEVDFLFGGREAFDLKIREALLAFRV